ncbi:MAG: hypothetical protein ACYS17_01685 [Planctomycetota bacterium]|jgi:hypothetical protein
MSRQRALKLIHLASTIWFIICISFIFVLTLRQAGVNWWILFSISGHGLLIALMLISLYLFAIFRGISSSQKVQIEHPLTSTNYYRIFYVITPLLGGLAGCLGMIGISTLSQFASGVALGTLGTTFLVWVIVDPLVGLLEMLLPPTSRRHHFERIAQLKVLRQNSQENRENLLKEVLVKEKLERQQWREELKPKAEQLASMLTADEIDFKQVECEAVGIGVNAWQMGGVSCMRELRNMAIDLAQERNKSVVDYIGVWWDGIGSWREPSLV